MYTSPEIHNHSPPSYIAQFPYRKLTSKHPHENIFIVERHSMGNF
jgi:hypothetical protein